MNEKEIFSKLQEILFDKFGIDKDTITLEADLVNDLGLDSFGAIELKFELENKFKIQIDNSEIASIRIIKDIVERIAKRMKYNK